MASQLQWEAEYDGVTYGRFFPRAEEEHVEKPIGAVFAVQPIPGWADITLRDWLYPPKKEVKP